jgi:hypothetical protein
MFSIRLRFRQAAATSVVHSNGVIAKKDSVALSWKISFGHVLVPLELSAENDLAIEKPILVHFDSKRLAWSECYHEHSGARQSRRSMILW